jgi:hypothetical protein
MEPSGVSGSRLRILSQAAPFIGCVAGARKRAVRNTQRVI